MEPWEIKLQKDFELAAIRDEINRMNHLENIPKEEGKRARTKSEDLLFWEVGRAHHGRRDVFGRMAEQAARDGDEEFFKKAGKYLAKIKERNRVRETFTQHVMWALIFVHNAMVNQEELPTKGDLKEIVIKHMNGLKIMAMKQDDPDWKNVWRASRFLGSLKQVRPGSVKHKTQGG